MFPFFFQLPKKDEVSFEAISSLLLFSSLMTEKLKIFVVKFVKESIGFVWKMDT